MSKAKPLEGNCLMCMHQPEVEVVVDISLSYKQYKKSKTV